MTEEPIKKEDSNKELLVKIRKRFTAMTEADDRNRKLAMYDMKFVNVPGEQWDDNMKIERGNRPCYEFNKLRITCKRIINEMRANRPSGKVRGVEDSDKDTAEIYEGLIRNIWNNSDGDTVIDTAAEYQVSGGMGAWRITAEYANDNAFDQDIKLEQIHNPFCLYADPSAKDPLKRDAHDFMLTEKISNRSFEEKYGKAEKVDWEETEFDDDEDWGSDEETRICEYWWKEPIEKEIWQLVDGKVIEADSDEAAAIQPEMVKKKRVVDSHVVKMVIASGNAILEGPTEWAGKELPFVIVYGEYMVIDGRIEWFGVPRFAKDAQRSYNISRTAIDETVAGSPIETIWATAAQAQGQTDKWAEAHQKNFPWKLYNADPLAPGPPQKTGGASVPVALMQQAQIASDDLKAVTGIFSPDVGASNNATSGRQEIARQQQGQIATFNYQDNLSKGVRRTWEILIDLIPNIFDTERSLRILGTDGAEDYVKINTFVTGSSGEQIKIHDLSEGSYDVTITTGPGFATKRQEAVEAYMGLTQGNPQIMGLAGDLIFKSMDLPYAEDIADRLKIMLPPEIQEMLNKDQKVPPEVQAMMQQAQQAMQQVQEQMQQVQQAAQEIQQERSVNEKAESEIQQLIANLKTEEARFEAKVAKELAKIAEKQAGIQVSEIQLNTEIDRTTNEQDRAAMERDHEALSEGIENALAAINQMSVEFAQYATEVLGEIEAKKALTKPKVVRIESRRENGKLIAIPIYETDQEEPGQADEA